MAKNLFDFSYEEAEGKIVNQDNKQVNQESIKEKIEQYSNKNQSELLEELYKNVMEQKNNGSFNYEKIKSMIDSISPYLTEEQKNNILGLLNKIR